ncbi:thiamine phosphate synthase [Brachybacterium fresconis]|uniref:Thiamine-phosphate synthase n=1 Tax=Brachybacterium fresconis TaxID=173363 RepID=A0ABS4YIP9_9MICO|nr:thiamine phosphate synthase [Brachybacterium fresconis]MBP2408636.1 thiamine-phosphate pyrophosphorylase [Brachybacterium fresconis]
MIRPSLRAAHAADLRLYHVTDSELSGGIDAVPAVVVAAVRGGAGMIQLRDKHATDADLVALVRECREVLRAGLGPRAAQIPLVVDDRLAVAEQTRCHLHVGQDDVPPSRAREILGDDLMIGVSTGTPGQVDEALADGSADVLGIGPIRATDTKTDAAAPLGLDGLAACLAPWAAARRTAGAQGRDLTCTVAIGGIDAVLAGQVAATGVEGVCVVSRIAAAADPERAAAELLAAFEEGSRRG